jgi:hypothetical protein
MTQQEKKVATRWLVVIGLLSLLYISYKIRI